MHGLHLVLRTLVLHQMDFGSIGIHTTLSIGQHSTRLPTALPQLVHQSHILVGQIVAIVVGRLP